MSRLAKIPFNKAHLAGKELYYIAQAVLAGELKGDGPFTHKCHAWLEAAFKTKKALLTPSCTAALELAAMLMDLHPEDEVLMPSFTFVSTANAFMLSGAKPRFVDIREDTLNIDERLLPALINDRTRGICVVHYAGVACDMDPIMEIANQHSLAVVEDAAHAALATYKGRPLGSIGHLGALSFHETKNFSCGEGGAILINQSDLQSRAEILREKGTDRSRFFRGEVDKYTWQDIGSSFLPSEIIAAFLYAQLEQAENINAARMQLWIRYRDELTALEELGVFRLPKIPDYSGHNAHMFYFLVETKEIRSKLLRFLVDQGVSAVFHYVPLHTAPMGCKLGYKPGMLPVTEDLSERLVRLPLFVGLSNTDQDFVINKVKQFFTS